MKEDDDEAETKFLKQNKFNSKEGVKKLTLTMVVKIGQKLVYVVFE